MLFAFTFLFEPGICERRLTLGLNHEAAFATQSKPLRPRVDSLIYDYNLNFGDVKWSGEVWA